MFIFLYTSPSNFNLTLCANTQQFLDSGRSSGYVSGVAQATLRFPALK